MELCADPQVTAENTIVKWPEENVCTVGCSVFMIVMVTLGAWRYLQLCLGALS